MDKLLLRVHLKTEELRLESRTLMDKSRFVYFKIVSVIYFILYLGYYALLWLTGLHRLSVFLVRKKKEVNILQYSDYDYIY